MNIYAVVLFCHLMLLSSLMPVSAVELRTEVIGVLDGDITEVRTTPTLSVSASTASIALRRAKRTVSTRSKPRLS
jgi:hypothetical protein